MAADEEAQRRSAGDRADEDEDERECELELELELELGQRNDEGVNEGECLYVTIMTQDQQRVGCSPAAAAGGRAGPVVRRRCLPPLALLAAAAQSATAVATSEIGMDQAGAVGVPLLGRIGDGPSPGTGFWRWVGLQSLGDPADGSSFYCYICTHDNYRNHYGSR